MSLINDVLRELETRRSEGSEGRSSGQQPTIVAGRQKSRRWPWWLMAAVVVGAVMHLVVRNSTQDFTRPALQAGVSRSLSTTVPASVLEPETESSPEPLPVPLNDATISQPDPSIDRGAPESIQIPPTVPKSANTTDTDTALAVTRPEAEPPRSTIVIERADRDNDASNDPYLSAQRSLARGRHALAESQLRELIDTRPDHARARYLLASLLLKRQRLTSAVVLLEEGLDRADPALAASLLGRLLADQGDTLRARQILLQHAPAVSLDPDYHLLLAAIERQDGDHQAAHDRYLAVTIASPDRSTAWIGLGTSLESLDQPQAARAAYQQALNGRDPQAAAFARNRLIALPDMTGERQ